MLNQVEFNKEWVFKPVASGRIMQDSSPKISTDDINSLISEYRLLNEQTKAADKRMRQIKVKLDVFMGESDTLISEDGEMLCTYSWTADAQVFDSKRFQVECPGLYEKYQTTRAGHRRLVLKGE